MMTYKPMKNGALNSYHLIQTIELIPCWCFFLIYPKNTFIAPCVRMQHTVLWVLLRI